MQQSPRLVHQLGEGSGRAGPPASVPPSTPRKNGEDLHRIICSLEERYQLGFDVSKEPKSSSQNKSAADRAASKIQQLFYSDKKALDEVLSGFAVTATFIPEDKRLEALWRLVIERIRQTSDVSRAGTPVSARSVPSTSRKLFQPVISAAPRQVGPFDVNKKLAATALGPAITDPGSPEDEDEDESEDEYNPVTPQSPSPNSSSPSPSNTSKSAQRRVEASAHISLRPNPMKRPYGGSADSEKPTKLTRISKITAPSKRLTMPSVLNNTPKFSARPCQKVTCDAEDLPASQSSVSTSSSAQSSPRRPHAETPNTSFEVDVNLPGPSRGVTINMSPMIGSLADHDYLAMGTEMTDGAMPLQTWGKPPYSTLQDRNKSSAWDSVSEDGLLEAEARVESLTLPDSKIRVQQQVRKLGPCLPPQLSSRSKLPLDGSAQSRNINDIAAARPLQRAQQEGPPPPLPSKISHRIRQVAMPGFNISEPPSYLEKMPYFVLFVCQRVALERSIPLTELTRHVDIESRWSDPNTFWSSLLEHPKVKQIKHKDPDQLWSAGSRGFEGFTFNGQLSLRSKQSGPIFQLSLHPVLSDKSCRFQRKFGADRFLYLKVPDLRTKNWNGGNQEDLKYIRKCWGDWLLAEHAFLLRKWRVFHVEPLSSKKKNRRNAEVAHGSRIVLFATEGSGIKQICTVKEMLEWFYPFANNGSQKVCKAYSRIELGLSRTTSTYAFKPSQVFYVKDKFSNGESEATEFNDMKCRWDPITDEKVMDDGCCIMSVGAAREIWKLYKKERGVDGPLPSALQGRIGGAKGLWMISAESYTKDPKHLKSWIKINKSQTKFKPHPDDRSDASFDPLRLTFEVCDYSSTPSHSELHMSFIPIMVDRGVPREVIADYIAERLDAERSELLESIIDPIKLYEYVHRKSSNSRSGKEIPWQAGMPLASDEQIKLLLEAGFSPLKLQALLMKILSFVQRQHIRQEEKLRTPLGKSTYIYGAADPLGVLKPGEVHIQFSSTFVDEVSGEQYLHLRDHNLLVARHPAIRRSDMQKVRAVCHPALSHLVDVVIFPSRGQFPLAGKLQGGDYDGDEFWLCWEESLVAPFQNAPAPVQDPEAEKYGIEVNRETLQDITRGIDGTMDVDEFLSKAFAFTNKASFLGIVTNCLLTKSYWENKLSSYELDCLGDIYSLIIDAAKQGRTFTFGGWQRSRKRLKCENLKQPAHKEAIEGCKGCPETELNKRRAEGYGYDRNKVLDYLYFEVVRRHNVETMEMLKTMVSATEPDADLVYPQQLLVGLKDPVVNEEVGRVKEEAENLYNTWNGFFASEKSTDSASFIDGLHTRYQALMPMKTEHAEVQRWLRRYLNNDWRMWDRLRASILYATLARKPKAHKFVFKMAGDELAKLKAETCPRTRFVVAEIRASLRPRRVRALRDVEGEDEEGEEDGDEE